VILTDAIIDRSSGGFRGGPMGTGSRSPHQRRAPTMFMCLAIYTTCACHLGICISEEISF